MRITESRLRRIIRNVILENDQEQIGLSEPPRMYDFYISDDADIYPRKLAAKNAAPKDFVDYEGTNKHFASQEDFVREMKKEIQSDVDYVLNGYNDYAEEMLNKAYLALFNGRDQESTYGSNLSQTEYRYSDLEQLQIDLIENKKSLINALVSLYSIGGNWSHYCGYQESAFA